MEFIEKVTQNTDVIVSIGHTNTTYEEALIGIERGITHATHLFNAMTGLTHRNPGAVGAALSTDISVELIADTFHIHKDLFNLVTKIKGNKLCLITDCVKTGGMPDGDYNYYGRIVHKEGIKCLLPDGTIVKCGMLLLEILTT